MAGVVKPRELSDYLLSQGRPVVTLSEVSSLLGVDSKHATSALVRLKRDNHMFSPARGLYIAVPPEYRTWGSIPALDFIDPMMTHIGHSYYVGFLSAAELHGAAHQHPQTFQVVTDGRVTDRDYGRVRVRFSRDSRAATLPVETRNTSTGTVRVATPAVVALDLAACPNNGGGLNNTATVLGELAADGMVIINDVLAVSSLYPVSALRRLGWLLDLVYGGIDTDPLRVEMECRGNDESSPTLLSPGGPRRGRQCRRWSITVNEEVEPDL